MMRSSKVKKKPDRPIRRNNESPSTTRRRAAREPLDNRLSREMERKRSPLRSTAKSPLAASKSIRVAPVTAKEMRQALRTVNGTLGRRTSDDWMDASLINTPVLSRRQSRSGSIFQRSGSVFQRLSRRGTEVDGTMTGPTETFVPSGAFGLPRIKEHRQSLFGELDLSDPDASMMRRASSVPPSQGLPKRRGTGNAGADVSPEQLLASSGSGLPPVMLASSNSIRRMVRARRSSAPGGEDLQELDHMKRTASPPEMLREVDNIPWVSFDEENAGVSKEENDVTDEEFIPGAQSVSFSPTATLMSQKDIAATKSIAAGLAGSLKKNSSFPAPGQKNPIKTPGSRGQESVTVRYPRYRQKLLTRESKYRDRHFFFQEDSPPESSDEDFDIDLVSAPNTANAMKSGTFSPGISFGRGTFEPLRTDTNSPDDGVFPNPSLSRPMSRAMLASRGGNDFGGTLTKSVTFNDPSGKGARATSPASRPDTNHDSRGKTPASGRRTTSRPTSRARDISPELRAELQEIKKRAETPYSPRETTRLGSGNLEVRDLMKSRERENEFVRLHQTLPTTDGQHLQGVGKYAAISMIVTAKAKSRPTTLEEALSPVPRHDTTLLPVQHELRKRQLIDESRRDRTDLLTGKERVNIVLDYLMKHHSATEFEWALSGRIEHAGSAFAPQPSQKASRHPSVATLKGTLRGGLKQMLAAEEAAGGGSKTPRQKKPSHPAGSPRPQPPPIPAVLAPPVPWPAELQPETLENDGLDAFRRSSSLTSVVMLTREEQRALEREAREATFANKRKLIRQEYLRSLVRSALEVWDWYVDDGGTGTVHIDDAMMWTQILDGHSAHKELPGFIEAHLYNDKQRESLYSSQQSEVEDEYAKARAGSPRWKKTVAVSPRDIQTLGSRIFSSFHSATSTARGSIASPRGAEALADIPLVMSARGDKDAPAYTPPTSRSARPSNDSADAVLTNVLVPETQTMAARLRALRNDEKYLVHRAFRMHVAEVLKRERSGLCDEASFVCMLRGANDPLLDDGLIRGLIEEARILPEFQRERLWHHKVDRKPLEALHVMYMHFRVGKRVLPGNSKHRQHVAEEEYDEDDIDPDEEQLMNIDLTSPPPAVEPMDLEAVEDTGDQRTGGAVSASNDDDNKEAGENLGREHITAATHLFGVSLDLFRTNLKSSMPPEEAASAFATADVDRDGFVCFYEFCKYLWGSFTKSDEARSEVRDLTMAQQQDSPRKSSVPFVASLRSGFPPRDSYHHDV